MPFSRKGRPHLYVAPVLEPGRRKIMGHADVKATTRYITHQPVGDPEWMLRAAQAMGLDRPHVRGA